MKQIKPSIVALFLAVMSVAAAERPQWMDQEGIVMAGSWEAPAFLARRAGYSDFKMPPEWLPGYKREHSREMIDSLQAIGVNFVMTHGYKGYGFEVEREGMEDAVHFANLLHEAGMRVGAYIGSTLGWETLFEEIPDARDWLWLDPAGEPAFYNQSQKHRYLAMKNHPGYKDYIKKAIRFAMEEMKVDLIHLDNTSQIGIGWDRESVAQFREFLRRRGDPDAENATPPADEQSSAPQRWRDWIEFRSEAIEQYYSELAEFVRSIDPQCAIDINPQQYSRQLLLRGVDHGRLLRHGHAYWDEAHSSGWYDGKLTTHIRSLKIGQSTNNSVFLYSETPLDVAEMLAFNLNCLGCVTWFEGGRLQSGHVGRLGGFPKNILPYIEFYHRHKKYYQNAEPVADVAILLDSETILFGSQSEAEALFLAEEQLQSLRIPYRILFRQQKSLFNKYSAIVAPRGPILEDFTGEVVAPDDPGLAATLKDFSPVRISAPAGVRIELFRQDSQNRQLLHFVNYDPEPNRANIAVELKTTAQPCRIFSLAPEIDNEQGLSFKAVDGVVRFDVPGISVYKLIVIEQL